MAADSSESTNVTGFSPQVAPRTPAFSLPGGLPGGSSEDRRRLIVGRDIVLSGSIAACEILIVEGRVEASLSDSKRIDVTETGTFKGTVEIDSATVAGLFEGELTVRERLVIKSSGRVVGKVRYGELEIQAGGRISGDIDVFGAPAHPAAETVNDDIAGAAEPVAAEPDDAD